MLAKRPLGQGAASRKYDVLTALGALACSGNKFQQRLILRFMTIITARYNWQKDELTVGRAELARLWQVDERTVKRDLGKLKLLGWLAVKRPSARGRVTAYSIDWGRILDDTRPVWSTVGPDFEARLSIMAPSEAAEPVKDTTVVAFPAQARQGDTEWDRAATLLSRTDPAFHANWLAAVERRDCGQGVLALRAPSIFHANYLNTHAAARLLHAVQQFAPTIHRVVVHPV